MTTINLVHFNFPHENTICGFFKHISKEFGKDIQLIQLIPSEMDQNLKIFKSLLHQKDCKIIFTMDSLEEIDKIKEDVEKTQNQIVFKVDDD